MNALMLGLCLVGSGNIGPNSGAGTVLMLNGDVLTLGGDVLTLL